MANNSNRVIFLDEISSEDLSLVGGKAMSLNEMLKAGINVPPAFCITTHVFKSGLNSEIEREILEAFDRLGAERVAVRSSAIAEDSKEASWAGQLETYLNVDRSGLIKAVEKCWDSVNSEHAREYAIQNKISESDKAVGVVIQKMVDSEISGVMFTANPVTNNLEEIVLESIYGLGELIVQGAVTPENFIIGKQTGEIIGHTPSRQKKMLIYKDGKNIETPVPPEKLKQSSLDKKDIKDLVTTAKKIEEHYGLPQDIEWAIAGNKLYITQSRPITTLDPRETEVSVEQEFLKQNDNHKIIRIEGDFVPFQLMVEWWNYYDARQEWGGLYPVLYFFTPKRTTFFLSHERYGGISVKVFSELINGKGSIKDFQNGYEKYKARITKRYKHYFLNDNQLGKEEDIISEFESVYKDFQEIVAWTQFYEQLDETAVNKVLEDKDIDLKKMWEMVELPSFTSFDTRKKEYMLEALEGKVTARYLCFAFSDYTFSADEQYVQNELDKSKVEELKAQIKTANEASVRARERLEEYLNGTDELTRLSIEILRWTLLCRDERKHIINQAELLLFHFSKKLFELWDIDQSLVRYTGASEILLGRDYIMSVKSELPKRREGFAVLYQTDRTAIIGYDNLEKQIDSLDNILLSQYQESATDTLKGEIGNRGQVTGRVHIIRRRDEFDSFKEGEILVTGMTRPEFVPLMRKAAGIITDEGAITSHAAIVSRELDKPCIIGTRIATQILKNGDEVELDADTGTVTILNANLPAKPPGADLERKFLEENEGDKVMRFEGDFMPFQLTIEWWHYIGPGYKEKSIKPVLSFFTPKRTTAFLSRDKYNGAAKETFAELVNGGLSLQKFKNEYEKFSARLSERYEDYFQKNIKPGNEKDSYDLFLKVYDDFHGLIVWTLFYEQLDEATVAEVLTGKDIDLNKVWEIVKLPVFSSFDTRRKEYLLSALEGKVTADYLRFAFSDYTFFADEKFVQDELAGQDIDQLRKEIEKAEETTDKAKRQLEEYLNDSDEFARTVIEVLGWVLFCRDERKDIINKSQLLLFHIAEQLFGFWDIDKDLLPYTGISDVLEGRDYMMSIKADLPKRPDGYCVLYQKDGSVHFGYDDLEGQIASLDDFILSQNKSDDEFVLRGEIGNTGHASGKARVIRKNAEFDDFKAGEILVTGMTRPEFVPLMKKASAIVTDEGGITSHAAIVSRELDKPCIMGTRIATQVIKTGDEVEVDANNGIITIL